MAKQGFATSDRRKVEIVPGDKAVQVHDCGTVFVTTGIDATAQAFTLPAISQAGEGWWCRIVTGALSTADNTVTMRGATDTAALVHVGVLGTDAYSHAANGGAADVVTIDHTNSETVGDEIEFLVANGQWFIKAISGK